MYVVFFNSALGFRHQAPAGRVLATVYYDTVLPTIHSPHAITSRQAGCHYDVVRVRDYMAWLHPPSRAFQPSFGTVLTTTSTVDSSSHSGHGPVVQRSRVSIGMAGW